jgi:hypothetical protein
MEPPHEPDHRARYPPKNQVQQQDALQFLAFELKLPCQDARDDDWERHNGRTKQVVVSRIPHSAPLRPEGTQVERDCRNEQRNRKMNQHNVLGVLGEYRRLEIKWIQRFTPRCATTATTLRPPGVPRSHLGVYNWTDGALFLESGGGYERTVRTCLRHFEDRPTELELFLFTMCFKTSSTEENSLPPVRETHEDPGS